MDTDWDLIIKPTNNLFDFRIRELIRYRDLIYLFIKRDCNTLYKQTILGPLWFILNPLFSAVIYTVIFGRLVHINTNGIPHLLFYYSSIMLWNYFSTCFTDLSNTFTTNAGLFGKIYFPRLTIPISRVFVNLITALIQLATLMSFYIWYYLHNAAIHLQLSILAFPVIFIWIGIFASGIGLLTTAITTSYRDLKQLTMFGLQLFMYVTPIIYPFSMAPEKYRWILNFNPLCAPIELFRIWLFGQGIIQPIMIISSIGITVFFFILGLIMFNRNARNFIDTI
jgi:lipopolysaccharide transport system permease protein